MTDGGPENGPAGPLARRLTSLVRLFGIYGGEGLPDPGEQ